MDELYKNTDQIKQFQSIILSYAHEDPMYSVVIAGDDSLTIEDTPTEMKSNNIKITNEDLLTEFEISITKGEISCSKSTKV